MILSLTNLKFFLVFFLLLMLADSSFAGFLPKAFEGDFIQIKKTRRSTKETPVKIKYLYPKNIRMSVLDKDNAVTYVCNAKKTWIYSPPFMEGEKGSVREGASSKYCYSKIFDALSRGLKTNKIYTVKKLKGNEFKLSFTKSAAEEIGFGEIEINFLNPPYVFKNIASMVMYDFSSLELTQIKLKLVKSKLKLSKLNEKIKKKGKDQGKLRKSIVGLKKINTKLQNNIADLEAKYKKSKKKPVILKTTKLKLYKSLSKDTFIFKIPKNTEVEIMN